MGTGKSLRVQDDPRNVTQNDGFDVEQELSVRDRIEIIDDSLRKKYLARLSDLSVVPCSELSAATLFETSLEDDIIENIRLFRIDEMVYRMGESVTEKLATAYSTLSIYHATVFILFDSDGKETKAYLGVRNNDSSDMPGKRSTVTLGDTLRRSLVGNFPGIRLTNIDRKDIALLSEKIANLDAIASASISGNPRFRAESADEHFVQGLEKLLFAMAGRPFLGLIVAEHRSSDEVLRLKKDLQDTYTMLSPYQRIQFSTGISKTESRSQSFSEMSAKQKAAMIGGAVASLAGVAAGAAAGAHAGGLAGVSTGSMIGGQAGGQLAGLIGSLAPSKQFSDSASETESTTTENKAVTDMLEHIDLLLKKTGEYDAYGMWNVAGYFGADDMPTAELAASNYRSLMNGERSGLELSAINSWRRPVAAYGVSSGAEDTQDPLAFAHLGTYLTRFVHPRFDYGGGVPVTASTAVSGRDLGLHLGLPRTTVPGLPVMQHAEFGKEVTVYRLFPDAATKTPEDRMTIGRIFDLGQVTDKVVELDNKSLNMHTFITGSTGSGKSNAVYQMLMELRQDGIPFLVVEPAKGEYKDAFGHLPDVRVFSTNPNVAPLLHINPFMFPPSIHVLEHVDGLVEIFGVCWPLYDAMPAFFKDAILRSYEAVGWDLGSSTFEGSQLEYPDFGVLVEQLDALISESEYAAEIKSNYRGSLLTRVRSLTVGLNKYLFSSGQTPYEQLFDESCILDISRVKSAETKALIMGLVVYLLNEYRIDRKTESNAGLRHVTVLEEAHNLLRNSEGGSSELVGKSVEMITNTIAEIRTFGEGFIIVDQSPSSVDIAAIKNTNTKIVLRTPEAHDRDAVGRSIGLTREQIEEIAKLPSGVAVIYQNNWAAPVLALLDKAPVEERPYVCTETTKVVPLCKARRLVVRMLMQPWYGGEMIDADILGPAMGVLDVSRKTARELERLAGRYSLFGGRLLWQDEDLPRLAGLLMEVLDISLPAIEEAASSDDYKGSISTIVSKRITALSSDEMDALSFVLTYSKGEDCEHGNV